MPASEVQGLPAHKIAGCVGSRFGTFDEENNPLHDCTEC